MSLCSCMLVVLQAIAFPQVVNPSPLNAINGVNGDEMPGCLHDCSIKAGFCENGGSCVKLDDRCSPSSYHCLCPPGFIGSRCSEVDEPCKYDIILTDFNCYCQNGATCLKVDNKCHVTSYRCDCPDGFEGEHCERVSVVDVHDNETESREVEIRRQLTTGNSSLIERGRQSSNFSSPGLDVKSTEVATSSSSLVTSLSPAPVSSRSSSSTSTSSLPPTSTSSQPPSSTSPSSPGSMSSSSSASTFSHPPSPTSPSSPASVSPSSSASTSSSSSASTSSQPLSQTSPSSPASTSSSSSASTSPSTPASTSSLPSATTSPVTMSSSLSASTSSPPTASTTIVRINKTKPETRSQKSRRMYDFLRQMRKQLIEQQKEPELCVRCVHGSCKRSDGGAPKCLCDPGYYGTFCDSQCIKDCKNAGKCVVSRNMKFCHCPAMFHGEFCEIARTAPDVVSDSAGTPIAIEVKTALSKDGKQFCSANFKCVHGICNSTDPTRPRCLCDEGYTGVFCHKKCSKKCLNKGTCIVVGDEQKCSCLSGYTGDICETKRRIRFPAMSPRYRDSLSKLKSFATNIVPTSKMPDKQRATNKCSENLVCMHGICEEWASQKFRCNCKDGFSGHLCQHKCSLRCANGGRCRILTGVPVCECQRGYKGKRCETIALDSYRKKSQRPSSKTRTSTRTGGSKGTVREVESTGNTTVRTLSVVSVNTTQAVQVNITETLATETISNLAENKT